MTKFSSSFKNFLFIAFIRDFSRNVILVSKLVPFEYFFSFSDSLYSIFYKSNLIGNGIMSDGLFRIDLQDNSTYNALHVQNKAILKEVL